MAEALKQYWYLAVALVAVAIFTVWVVKKAAEAASRTRAEHEAQMKKLEYESGVRKEFAELSEEKLRSADKKCAFDGVAMNIQRYLEKQSNMNAAFAELPDAKKQIYALYYLFDDSQKGLSEFFKCNSAPLTPEALKAVESLFPRDAAEAFAGEYRAYDPDDETASLIPAETEKNDEKYAQAMKDFDFYNAAVEFIIKNLNDFC